MEVKVEVAAGCDPAKVYAALLGTQEGVNAEDLEPWAVTVDAPYAAYVEFGTGPARPKEKGTGDPEVLKRFMAWADAKGWGAKAGWLMYKRAMQFGILPNPYLRPAMYSVIEDLTRGVWRGPATPKEVAEEIAARAVRIVLDDHMGAGDLDEGVHLAELITADLDSNTPSIQLHSSVTADILWSESGQLTGVQGKHARITPRTR